MTTSIQLDRRAFLTSAGALAVTLATPAKLAFAQTQSPNPASANNPALRADRLSSYVALQPDGMLDVYFGAIDGGQGIEVSIAQMVAEEADVAFEKVRVVLGDTRATLNMGGASGAQGVSRRGTTLGATAAELRRLLLQAASARLNVPVEGLRAENGVITVAADSARKIAYTDLIGDVARDAQVKWNGRWGNPHGASGQAKKKSPAEYKIVGKSIRRKDLPLKVFGQLEYVNDVRLPGMLHARMIRPPVAGAVPLGVDETSIKDIPGARVVRVKDLIAVVAEKEWNAVRAREALMVEWSSSTPNFPGHDGVFTHIREAKVIARHVEVETGAIEKGMQAAARTITGEYEYPFHSHSSMGPACAVADYKDGKCTLWSSTQKPHFAADGIADLLGLKPDDVHVVWKWGTGSYGRNDQGDAGGDAAVLSKELGRPVRVQYMRDEGTAWSPKGTAAVNKFRAGLAADGTVTTYEFISKAFSRENISTNEGSAASMLAGHLLGVPLKPRNTFNIPFASYTFENNRLGWEVIPPLMERASPLRTTHLRDPYGPPILFGSECFMDELAQAANMDPVDFRLRYLKHPRDINAVKVAAEKAGWQKRVGPQKPAPGENELIGRGIAYRRHFETFIALVAEVRVHRETGLVEPIRYICAHDCGMIVNPETVHHVVERQLVYGTSRTFFEELQFDDKMVTSVDWMTYPVLADTESLPEIDIVLIGDPNHAPSGAAEMALGLVPAAVGNAIYDATGVRIRRVPFTPERVKDSLDRA